MEKNTNNIDEIYLQGQKAFYALREEVQTSGCAGMSLDEINEVIRKCREERRQCKI